jgi:hypothetical protein
MKPITSNTKQAIIKRNKTFSNSTIVVLQMIVKFKIGHFKIKEEELDSELHLYPKLVELKRYQNDLRNFVFEFNGSGREF